MIITNDYISMKVQVSLQHLMYVEDSFYGIGNRVNERKIGCNGQLGCLSFVYALLLTLLLFPKGIIC